MFRLHIQLTLTYLGDTNMPSSNTTLTLQYHTETEYQNLMYNQNEMYHQNMDIQAYRLGIDR